MDRRVFLLALLAVAAAASAQVPKKPGVTSAPAFGAVGLKSEATLTGVLAQQNGAAVLKAKDKTYRLISSLNNPDVTLTLADERNAGRELQVLGRWKDSETFDVVRFFRVREAKLYKITYFCQICNITTYRPGICDCCQNPTEVREIARDPLSIY